MRRLSIKWRCDWPNCTATDATEWRDMRNQTPRLKVPVDVPPPLDQQIPPAIGAVASVGFEHEPWPVGWMDANGQRTDQSEKTFCSAQHAGWFKEADEAARRVAEFEYRRVLWAAIERRETTQRPVQVRTQAATPSPIVEPRAPVERPRSEIGEVFETACASLEAERIETARATFDERRRARAAMVDATAEQLGPEAVQELKEARARGVDTDDPGPDPGDGEAS